MLKYIAKWSDPPSARQILEVLDLSINGSLASGFIISLFQVYYDAACKREGTTHEEVIKDAPWRAKL